MNIITTIKQLAELGTTAAQVVAALQAIRSNYSDEAVERLETEHPLIADLLSAAVELEAALETEG